MPRRELFFFLCSLRFPPLKTGGKKHDKKKGNEGESDMKCKVCGTELQKVPILGNTKEYALYCSGCSKDGRPLGECFSDEVFTGESWRTGLNGKRSKV